MKKMLIVAVMMLVTAAHAGDITGAGATFPFPIYAKWAEDYNKATGTGLNYQSIGSSGGVRQIRNNTVTFGATDAPLTGAELERDGLVQFPTILGGVVPVVNLEGFGPGQIRLTGEVLADIYLGNITKWNDQRIQTHNMNIKLPDVAITVAHRADGSGTTHIFTDYLSEVSPAWSRAVGRGAAVKWPAASSVGGKGNEGVAANVVRVKGAIGYVEYAYAKKNRITYITLKNRDGQWVEPDDLTFAAAAAGADWFATPGMGISLVNQKGSKSWPITGASFVLMYREPKDRVAAAEVLKFFDHSFRTGGAAARDLDYVPLPAALADRIRRQVWSQIKTQ